MAVNPNTSTILGSFNAMVPKEGPKVVPVNAQLGANASVVIDLTQIQQQGRISFIQGLMADNSQNTQALTITSQAFNQKIVIPAGAQAILPVFVINPPIFIAASGGGVNVPLFFFNVPLPAQVWNEGGAFQINGSGYLLVSDPALEALIANLGGGNALNVNVVSGGSSSTVTTSGIIFSHKGTNGGTDSVTSAASGASEYWNITALSFTVSSDLSIPGGSPVTFTLSFVTQAATIWEFTHTPPSSTGTANDIAQAISNISFASPIKGSTLNDTIKFTATGGAAAASGSFIMNLYGYTST